MKKLFILASVLVLFVGAPQLASAQEGETWITQPTVYNVTLIKIYPNMQEQYLNNLKRTWATAMDEVKKEGLITDYMILASVTPNDGGYNLLLLTEHPNLASLDASDEWRAKNDRIQERVEAIISEQETDRITATVYPNVREILSQKLLREVKFMN